MSDSPQMPLDNSQGGIKIAPTAYTVTTVISESVTLTAAVETTRLVRLPRDKAHLIRLMEQVERPTTFTIFVNGQGEIKAIARQVSDFEFLK